MKRRRRSVVHRDTVPLPGGRVAELVQEGDPESRPVAHRRAIDTVGLMWRNGTVTAGMRDAARDFHAAFTIAQMDPLRAADIDRVLGTGGGPASPTDAHIGARRRINSALAALGGVGSPGGSAVWHVVGLGMSVREWATVRGWAGRPLGHAQAQGVLVAALGVLAAHYGYERTA